MAKKTPAASKHRPATPPDLAALRRVDPIDAWWAFPPEGTADGWDVASLCRAGAALTSDVRSAQTVGASFGALLQAAYRSNDAAPSGAQLCEALTAAAELTGDATVGFVAAVAAAASHYRAHVAGAPPPGALSPVARCIVAYLLHGDGDDDDAADVLLADRAGVAATLAGPYGAILTDGLVEVLFRADTGLLCDVLNRRDTPFLGSAALEPITAARVTPDRVELCAATARAFARWAAWGEAVRRGPLLPQDHFDPIDTRTLRACASSGAVALHIYAFENDDAMLRDMARDLLEGSPLTTEALDIAGTLGAPHPSWIAVPWPGERDELYAKVRHSAARIERLWAQARHRRDGGAVSHEAAVLRTVLGAVRRERDAVPIGLAEITARAQRSPRWAWWIVEAAMNTPGASDTAIAGVTMTVTSITDPDELSRHMFDRVCERLGYDPHDIRRRPERAAATLHDAIQQGASPTTAFAGYAVSVAAAAGSASAAHVLHTIMAPSLGRDAPAELHEQDYADFDLRGWLVVTAALEAASRVLERPERTPLTAADDGTETPAQADARRAQRVARRAARRARSVDTDPGPVAVTDVAPSVAAVDAALERIDRHPDRRPVFQAGDWLTALTDEVEPDELAPRWERLGGLLRRSDVRDVLGDADADLQLVRALDATGARDAAAAVAVGAYWRLHNAGEPAADIAALARELGGVVPDDTPSPDPVDVSAVTVLFVGGREEQIRAAALIDEELTGSGVDVVWQHPAWTSNTDRAARQAEQAMVNADVVVIMTFVPTNLGERLRRACTERGLPWVPCTGHGRASMRRAVLAAADVARELRSDP